MGKFFNGNYQPTVVNVAQNEIIGKEDEMSFQNAVNRMNKLKKNAPDELSEYIKELEEENEILRATNHEYEKRLREMENTLETTRQISKKNKKYAEANEEFIKQIKYLKERVKRLTVYSKNKPNEINIENCNAHPLFVTGLYVKSFPLCGINVEEIKNENYINEQGYINFIITRNENGTYCAQHLKDKEYLEQKRWLEYYKKTAKENQ